MPISAPVFAIKTAHYTLQCDALFCFGWHDFAHLLWQICGPPPRKTAQKSHYRAEYRAIYETRREVRLEAGLTQTDLAEQLGRSQNFVSQAELGYKRLDGLQLMDWVDRSG
jgi:DNA-binding XRE family transcriptional regulator